jgi:RNA polymerase sigma-70 factor (ECF subfamily)
LVDGDPLEAREPEPESVDFDVLFRRYAPYVGTIGLRILGRRSDAEDLVQDVFAEAHRGLSRLRDPKAAKSWLGTIAVRVATRKLRRRRVGSLLGAGWGSGGGVDEYVELPSPELDEEERAALISLYRVLDELPVHQRTAWVLRKVEGETNARVAELCRCSLATAKRRIEAAQAVIDQAFDDAPSRGGDDD